ncbi:MAG: hypothetical protein AAB425_06375 [Bdellovibrionota bacterium]
MKFWIIVAQVLCFVSLSIANANGDGGGNGSSGHEVGPHGKGAMSGQGSNGIVRDKK